MATTVVDVANGMEDQLRRVDGAKKNVDAVFNDITQMTEKADLVADNSARTAVAAQKGEELMGGAMKKMEGIKSELLEPDVIGPENFDTLIVGWGSTLGPITEAVALLNTEEKGRYAALVFGDVYPLPQKKLREMAPKANQLINVEQNATGQLAGLIREETGIAFSGSILKYDGRQITAEEIAARIRKEGF